jgi:hypothetical protein
MNTSKDDISKIDLPNRLQLAARKRHEELQKLRAERLYLKELHDDYEKLIAHLDKTKPDLKTSQAANQYFANRDQYSGLVQQQKTKIEEIQTKISFIENRDPKERDNAARLLLQESITQYLEKQAADYLALNAKLFEKLSERISELNTFIFQRQKEDQEILGLIFRIENFHEPY